jgi:biotin carboxyl carrier protein
MARLMEERSREPGDGRSDSGPAVAGDPRAVRARLADTSQLGDEPVVRVAPPAALRPMVPSVGVGPLGGSVVSDPSGSAGIADDGEEAARVFAQRQPLVDGVPAEASLRPGGRGRLVLELDGQRSRVVVEPSRPAAGGVRVAEVLVDGFRFDVELESERIAALRERATKGGSTSAHSGELAIKAIIPGKVVAVSVAAGDAVVAGQQLLVIEAMKMQNELRSPRDGTVERVGVAPGINVEVGDLLVVIS